LTVFILSLTVTAYGAIEPSTVTTFNDTIEISSVTKIGDIYSDETFDMAEIDKALEASDKPVPVEDDYELYYAVVPVTIMLKKTDRYDYGISTYYYYYFDETAEPKADITDYDTFIYDYYNYSDAPIPSKAFQGTITLDKPGPYYLYVANSSAVSDDCDTGIYIIVEGQTTTAPVAPAKVQAVPTSSTVLVNGKSIAFDAYNINGNNYFKLRDIARAFNIGITWDRATNTIGIDISMDYVED